MKKVKQKIKNSIIKFLTKEDYINTKKRISELEKQVLDQHNQIQNLMLYQIYCQDDAPKFYPNALNNDEIEVLKKYLNNSKYYLEFGSGGSTFLALSYPNIKRIISVESDYNWIKYLSSWKIIRNSIDGNKLSFIHIDIGKTKEWGFPVDNSKISEYYKYSCKVFENNPYNIDLILIDGRFRVACVLKSIMEIKQDVIIMFHDYPERPHYHIIEKFLDIVETRDRLYIFKKKSNIDYNDLSETFENYKNDCR